MTAPPFDALPCAWLQLDTRGVIVAANRALGELVDEGAAPLCGRSFDTLLSAPSRVLYQSYLQPVLRMHGHVEEIGLTLRATARREPLDVLFYSGRSPGDGMDAPLQVLLAPIRRRRDIDAAMLRIKRAADLSPGLIFQLMQLPDGREHFPYVSEAVRLLYGVSAEEARHSAEALFAQIEPEDRRRLSDGLRDCAAHGREAHLSFRVRREGGERWHEMHCTPRLLAHEVRVWHGHIADVTDRRRLEQALAERQAADRLNRMRGEFLARVSHELRTPLNGILGFAQLLAHDGAANLSEVQRDRLEVLRASGRHLLQLVNQLLDVAAIDSGHAAIERMPTPLLPTLQEALHLVRTLADERGVRLVPPPADATPAGAQVMGQPLRLRQVFVNLLSNAVKYNRAGGEVSVRAHRSAGRWRVAVADTGAGLSAEQQRGLFQPFNRLGAQDTSVEGTGLGLVITRHLLSLMGAEIEVDSRPGQGSTFTVVLAAVDGADGVDGGPGGGADGARATAGPWALSAAAMRGAAAAPSVAPSVASSAAPGTRGRLLYVEDNAVNVILMEAIVGMRPGCSLRVARDGARALELLAGGGGDGWQPDLLLLDMHLPDVRGEALLAAIRERVPALARVPAIVVSAAAAGAEVQAALAAGFAAYWTKPLDVDQTLAELDRWLAAVPRQAPR